MKEWFALKPTKFGAPNFDGTRQTLVWPVFDANDQRVDIELAYSEFTSHAIGRIEQLNPTNIATGTLIIARVFRGISGLSAEPLSLVHPPDGRRDNPVDALHFDDAVAQGFVSKWLSRIRSSTSRDAATTPDVVIATVPRPIRDLKRWLCQQAERGVRSDAEASTTRELRERAEKLVGDGFTAFTQSKSTTDLPSKSVVIAHYLCLQYERLVDESSESLV